MMRMQRSCAGDRRGANRPAVAVVLLLAAMSAGCSADVARFDFGLGQNDGPSAIPRPTVPMRSGGKSLIENDSKSTAGNDYAAPAPSRDSGVRMAALPPPTPSAPPSYQPPPPQSAPQPMASAARAPAAAPVASGQTIEVQSGDTLFGLSKRHKVPVSELMSVNGLKGPALKPGQKLVLPAAAGAMKPGVRSRPTSAQTAAASAAVGAEKPAARVAPATTSKAANWDGSYTVKPGDSLYAIARRHKVSQNELQQVNGIADPLKVRPGTALKVPADGGAASVAASVPRIEAPARIEPVAEVSRPIASNTQPTIINGGEKKLAARTDTASDVTPGEPEKATPVEPSAQPSKGEKSAAAGAAAATASTGKLRWPVKGKVVTGFGPRPDGTHNDGVNVSVPQGTEVHAAEGGVVAYAGSELKGYGNLILIRHDNGWVTAYAHNDELIVKRGERVKRGQVLAKAGKSGQVDQPQVHFELRQGSKPVDPTPFMEKM